MEQWTVREKQLRVQEFLNRENQNLHQRYDQEMYQYELLRLGDPRAVEESDRAWLRADKGRLADHPLRSARYMFVATATLASRFAIQGGMDCERAYTASDLYINKLESCRTVGEIALLRRDMFTFFTRQVAQSRKENIYSKPVVRCIDHIYDHLYEPIRVQDLADAVGLNASYLSTLFRKETGVTVSDYVLEKRMEAAQNMLKYSDYTYAEISACLAFSSQSHFSRCFKKKTGHTPSEYRRLHLRDSL